MVKSAAENGYSVELADRARSVCLLLATVLGDLMDEIVVVGGLVPYLIIDQERVAVRHVGTKDLDIGLSLTLLDEGRYKAVGDRLRDKGFVPALNKKGNLSHATWVHDGYPIDFLIPPSSEDSVPGSLQHLEDKWAAYKMPSVALAFRDIIPVLIDGQTPGGVCAKRTVNVCGPAAFVASKALAFHKRGNEKDAYDLVYMLKNYGEDSLEEIIDRFRQFGNDPTAQEALRCLAADFPNDSHNGPNAAARFMTGEVDDELLQEAVTYVQALLADLGGPQLST
ncbi:nucleotidyl transferase AbiEii/AbiGii toxin family protein [Myxococcota bacterium]|jgi:predicted nucleotidyltransferase|nr:nucleotidyl transferase AbiEii/AbiGii toxin family protein [Myxococcota bacterium]